MSSELHPKNLSILFIITIVVHLVPIPTIFFYLHYLVAKMWPKIHHYLLSNTLTFFYVSVLCIYLLILNSCFLICFAACQIWPFFEYSYPQIYLLYYFHIIFIYLLQYRLSISINSRLVQSYHYIYTFLHNSKSI